MAIIDKYISHITPLGSPDAYKLKAYLLKNGRTFKVKLNSTNASTAFDGSANITDIGVTGVLPIANGGTGANSRVNAYKALVYAGEFTGDIDATNNEAGIWSLGADNSYTGESLKTDLGITTLPNWSIFYQLPYVNTQLIFEGNPGQIYIRDREGSGSSLAWKTWKVLKQKPDNAGHADTATAANITSTDNAIVRFDGTAGKFQNSTVIIDDNGYINSKQFKTSSSETILNDVGYITIYPYDRNTYGNTTPTPAKFIFTEKAYTTGVPAKTLMAWSGIDNIKINNFIGALKGNADTATALSSTGTTAQFWRGDNKWSNELSGGLLKITNNSNTVTIGSANADYAHFSNSADIPFYFNKSIWVNGDLYPYNTTNTRSLGSSSKRWKSLFIGTNDDYGTQYIPIYWNAGVPTQITTNSVLTNLASTTAASTYAASPRPGVTGTLGTANGGTGNTSFTKDTLIYANTATKLASYTSTKGGTKKLWYLNAGIPTDSSETVGATDKPVFLSSGTITASTSTIGSGIIPIYMASGQIKASTSTVGSFEKPTYLNAGTITALNPVWLLSGGTATANNEDLNAAKYKAIGNYYSDGDAKSKTILNSPFGAAASTNCLSFTLKTEASLGTGTTYLRQLWRSYNSGVEAERTSGNSGSSWSTWRTKVFKNSDAATAAGNSTTPVYVTANGAVATGYPYLRYINSTDVTTYSVDELGKTASIAYIRATDTNAPTSGHMMYINAGIGHMGTRFQIGIHDSSNLYVYKRWYSSSAWSAWTKMNAGNADTASKLTDITTADAASSSATWRYVWFSYNDNTTGRPAYSSNLVFQTSTNTLKATKFQGALVGNADTATAANITSTDNAIVRFDGTAGKFQNSKALVDDSGGITLGGSYLIIKPFSSTYDTTGSHAGIKFYFNHDRSGYNADTLITNYSLQATNFYGALKGNADTATAFSSNATVTLTGDTTGTSAGSTKSWSVPTVTSALTVKGGRVATADSAHAAADYSKMYLRIATSTMTTNKPKFSVEGETPATHDGHILEFHWDNSGIYNEQLALSNTNAAMSIRACSNSATWHNWTPILTSTNVLWSAWGAGTTAGPTAKLNIGGTTITSAAIPSASTSASGVVTTGAQQFKGRKKFGYLELYGEDAGTAKQYLDIIGRNNAGTQVAEIYYNFGNATNITTGVWSFRQWSPNSTENTTTSGGYETYSLPTVTTGLSSGNHGYSILTTKNTVTVAQGGTGNTSYTANRLIYSESASKLSAHGSLIISTETTYASRTITPLLRVNGILMANTQIESAAYFMNNGTGTSGSHGYYLYRNNAQYARLFVSTVGTVATADAAGTAGVASLYLGNATAQPAAGATTAGANNAYGRILLYGTGTTYTILRSNPNGSRTIYLPHAEADGYLVCKTTTAAVGGTGTPVYVDANGVVQACTAYGSATAATSNAVKTTLMTNASTAIYVLGATGTAADTSATVYKGYRTSTVKVYFRGDTGVLMGAAWNDYAEYRQAKDDIEIEPGRVVKEVGNETLELTTERLQRGCSIVSNTFGISIGESETNKLPLAVAGRVLAYPYENREDFKNHIGWPVCSGPNGTVSIMTEEEEMKYPSRIIGTISAVPDYEVWHGGADVIVDGRVWIKVR